MMYLTSYAALYLVDVVCVEAVHLNLLLPAAGLDLF